MGAAKTKGKGGCERDLYKHSGCSTTSVQVGGGRCLLSAESGLLVAQVPRRGVVREVLLVEGNSKEHHERGGGAQEPEPEGLVLDLLDLAGEAHDKERDTEEADEEADDGDAGVLRSGDHGDGEAGEAKGAIAGHPVDRVALEEVGEEELLTIAADVHERDREEVEAVDHVDVEEQALVVPLHVVLPRVHGRVEEVDAIEGNGEGGDENNRGDQEAGPDEVAVDDAAVVVKDDGGGEVEEAAAVDGERAQRDAGVAGLDELGDAQAEEHACHLALEHAAGGARLDVVLAVPEQGDEHGVEGRGC